MSKKPTALKSLKHAVNLSNLTFPIGVRLKKDFKINGLKV